MKRLLYLLPVLFWMTGVWTSCDSEENGPSVLGGENVPYYSVQDDDTYLVTDLLQLMTLPEGDLVSEEVLLGQVSQREQALKMKYGKENLKLGYRKVVYLYNSTDVEGEPITLSAAAYWPGYFEGTDWTDIAPEDICLMEHYTITSDAESPSGGFPFEVLVTGNALVLMPDYLGYGVTRNKIHPYLNHEVCAVNSVDALPAGYFVFDELTDCDLAKDWELCVLGVSQGGGNALAVHKYMDTHLDFAKTWRFAYSSSSSGPYNPVLTIDRYFESGKVTNPVLFPLTLKAMFDSYPDIMAGYTEDMMYSEAYLEVKEQVDRMLSDKKHATTEISQLLYAQVRKTVDESLAADEVYLTDILSETALNRDSDMMKALYRCLEKNDLTQGWTPVHPIRIHYSTGDRMVPYENSIAVQEAFGSDKVTLTPTAAPVEHFMCCALWMVNLFMFGL